MAREGTSKIVSAKKKEKWINIYQSFGWELEFTDDMDNGDVKLIFGREKTIPNHARLIELEKQYFSIKLYRNFDAGALFGWIFAALPFGFFGIIAWLMGISEQAKEFSDAGFIITMIGVGIFTLAFFLFLNDKNKYRKNKRKRRAISNAAKKLL